MQWCVASIVLRVDSHIARTTAPLNYVLHTYNRLFTYCFALCSVIIHHTLLRKIGRVYLLLVFLRPVTDISATMASIGMKVCTTVHIGPGQIFSLFEAVPPCPPIQNFGHMTANIAKMVSCNVTGQLELNINSMGLSKMKVMGSSHPPPGSAPPYGGFVSC